jgi:hypothetical protein
MNLEETPFYSHCFRTEEPEDKYQLVIRKDMYSDGTIVYPDNDALFEALFSLLIKGRKVGGKADPLFRQRNFLNFHYLEYTGDKQDWLRYTKRRYLSRKENLKPTPLLAEIDQEIMEWFSEKEKISSQYEDTIRIYTTADEREAERMEIPEGTKYTYIPEAKSFSEALERLKNLGAQQYCEYLQREFFRKYAQLDLELISDELTPIRSFIEKAEKLSRKEAFGKADQDSSNEYLRLKHGYYLNHMCDWIFGGLPSRIYGEYFLFREWLEAQMQAYAPKSFADWFLGETAWAEVAWQRNTGNGYQHKQDLAAVFLNAYRPLQQKIPSYFQKYKQIDREYLTYQIFRFREHFPLKGRIEDISYFDDLIEMLMDQYPSADNAKQKSGPGMVAGDKSFAVTELYRLDDMAIIERGEGKYIEFKSTFSYDLRQNKKSAEVEHSALKTIAAFLNSYGGILLIGVEDNRNVIGMESEYKLLSKPDKQDQFCTRFDDIVSKNLGSGTHKDFDLSFVKVGDKEVCRIVVPARAAAPVFLVHNGDHHFYIRRQASTEKLNISQVTQYIITHWQQS